MYDDTGDIDQNGVPDSIQRDPVVEREPLIFGEPAEPGLPGITEPIEATADAPAEPAREVPVQPTLPPADADEATIEAFERELVEYQHAMQRLSLTEHTLTNLSNMRHETLKGIAQNFRG
jgi:alpha-beta hydrolase superfamily lysophospholipase